MTGADFTLERIAHRYAQALYEAAVEAAALQEVEAHMEVFATAVEKSPALRHVIDSPLLGREAQWRAVSALLEVLGITGLTRNFLGVVIHRRRLFAWARLYAVFRERVREERGQIPVVVRLAAPLDKKGRRVLLEALRQSTGKIPLLEENVDPTVLAGCVVRVGSYLFDASLASAVGRFAELPQS